MLTRPRPDHIRPDVRAAVEALRAAEEAWALQRDLIRERMRKEGLTAAEFALVTRALGSWAGTKKEEM